MATVESASYGAKTMVDCTPEPLMEPTKNEEKEVEDQTTSPTETGSCISSSDLATESGLSEEEEESEEDSSDVPLPDEGKEQKQASAHSMALNDAFMALEDMRKANLEVEFGGKAIPNVALLHEYCTTCLHEKKQREDAKMKRLSKDADFMANPNNEKRRTFLKQMMTRVRTRKRSPPCLICSSPVCKNHCCQAFKKEKITVCGKCSQLFTMDFVVAAIASDSGGADQQKRRECIAHMIDSYDRALLMLQFSSQYIDEIADALENRSRTSDHIGLGSSGVGLMSGFTGVAAVAAQFVAAAAILSPAGPPLVLASIFFGASAAAASTGTEAINYYSEPNQLACKIVALYDLLRSLLGVTAVLKDAIENGRVDPRHITEMGPNKKISSYWKSRLPPKIEPVMESPEETDEENDDKESVQDDPKAASTTAAAHSDSVDTKKVSSPDASVKEQASAPEGVGKTANPATATESQEVVKPEPEPSQYSLADIDDDDDGEPVSEEKNDAATTVTESTSFESEAEPVTPEEEEAEKDEKATQQGSDAATTVSTAAVMVATPSGGVAADPSKDAAADPEQTKALVVAPSNKRTALSRAMTNSMKIAQFASIACVMLSAATIIMETKNLRDTLESLRRGSPCDKAAMLRKIKKEIGDLPATGVVAGDCNSYLRAAERQEQAKKQQAEREE